MTFKPVIIVGFLCVFANALTAQVEKKVYQTLALSDTTEQINFNFPDNCEVISWKQEGKIMIETVVSMEINSKEVVNSLVQCGRYTIVADDNPSTFVKTLKFAAVRPTIKNVKGEAIKEKVTLRVYLPEGFSFGDSVACKSESEVLVAKQ